MKKQFHKIKIAAENFSRQSKADKNSEELLDADRKVEKYKEVLDKICRKFVQNASNNVVNVDQDARDKRCKKVHEHKLAQAMEESLKDLPNGLLRDVLENCAKLERNIAVEIVNNEINVENDVTKKLATILENHIGTIQKQKRIVTKLIQDNESAKHKYQAAIRVNDSTSKINQLREEQEECETRLEKERDIWAAEMFELIAEEDNMANYVINYIKYQQLYYKSALEEIEDVMNRINGFIKGNNKKIFKVPLEDHLAVTNRTISYVIELCVCALLEKGIYEEGLLRVGCAGSKLRRLKSAIDANLITTPYPSEYQDVHVIASVLKSYLRDLPEPLLTFQLYDQFISASQRPTEDQRKTAILNTVCQLPRCNYDNLKYLTKFLELLSQRSKANKMSPQNIAIVMAPNLLWDHETNDGDYVSKVNSTASVNTIVEALVSDWSFFFGNDFVVSDFYVTMTRDELFPHNGGFPIDRDCNNSDINMIKSMNITPITHSQTITNVPSSSNNNNNNNNNSNPCSVSLSSPNYQTHSRSSSHDTGRLILETERVCGSSDSISKRSQSNSSLSDSSPPRQNSPKQPQRRKGNKGVAPTPPNQRTQRASEYFGSINSGSHNESMQAAKERFLNSNHTSPKNETKLNSNRFLRTETNAQHTTNAALPTFKQPTQPSVLMKQCSSSTENLATKPDKPPRPAMPVIDSQTLVRNAFKAKANERHNRPIALPRNILNVARSTENLCSSSIQTSSNAHGSNDENEPVPLRDGNDHSNRGDKPAIPERPTSLMKPNFRTAIFDKFETAPTTPTSQDPNGSIKKTQSFRMSSTPAGAAVGSITGRSLTTLERTHIYNVDKKQVEIIDVDQQSNSNGSTDGSNGSFDGVPINGDKLQLNNDVDKVVLENPNAESNTENSKSNDESNDNHLLNVSTNSNTMSTSTISNSGDVGIPPQSPRSFEMKNIKRPQVPAPPPPNVVQTGVSVSAEHTNIENHKLDRAKTQADSTKL